MWIHWPFFPTRRFSNHESRLISQITYFCNHCNIRFENTDQSMWIHWPFFPKTWTKGHWPLDDLWPHVCWGHMCDSTQGSLCPSPMTVHQCIYSDQFCKIPHTYTYIHTHTTSRMSDHIVSYWTQFRRDKNLNQRSMTPRWPLNPCLLRSHVWLYPRIIVSKSHDNTSMYVDTVINSAKYHIHTTYIHTTYILRTEWVITII